MNKTPDDKHFIATDDGAFTVNGVEHFYKKGDVAPLANEGVTQNEPAKPYYDCPIKAAHMAKHFGMLFTSLDSRTGKYRTTLVKGKTVITTFDIAVIQSNIGSPVESIRENQKYYIRPDSIHLLDMQIGDVVDDGSNLFIKISSPDHIVIFKGDKTIQRNNEAFFWPKWG